MSILIIGAAGTIGQRLVTEALNRNHHVAALIREGDSLDINHEYLNIHVGDALSDEDVSQALNGCDVVISTLGHGKHTPAELQADAMRIITSAMKHNNIQRLVSLTGAGVYTPDDTPSLFDRFLTATLLFVQPHRIQDGIKHVEILKESGCNWTVVRTPKHSNRGPSEYRIGLNDRSLSLRVSRDDIVDFMLKVATSNQYVHELPTISSTRKPRTS